MLLLQNPTDSDISYEFRLHQTSFSGGIDSYELHCPELGSSTNFKFDVFVVDDSIFPNLTASLFFFKNQHFLSKDIVKLHIKHGTNITIAGYFFKLTSIFQSGILTLPKHLYTAVKTGLSTLFNSHNTYQTKTVVLDRTNFSITDFYDDDLVILILADQLINKIPNFSLKQYLPDLYFNGFVTYSTEQYKHINDSSYIQDNYQHIRSSVTKDGVHALTISPVSNTISTTDYIFILFENLIHQEHDNFTRFILLYQIIEILIEKIFKRKIQELVCDNISTLTSYDLKNKLPEVGKESARITWLFNSEFSLLPADLNKLATDTFKDFFVATNDTDFGGQKVFTLSDLLYGYRNKLVHNYRYLHDGTLDAEIVKAKMSAVNRETEVLMCVLLTTYRK